MKSTKTTDALTILHHRFYKDDTDRQRSLEVENDNVYIAEQIYALRKAKGLTQKQLAGLIGAAPSSISRLESADYEGHSLAMLRRIADALDRTIRIEFIKRKHPTTA